jgi:hypothetical protein
MLKNFHAEVGGNAFSADAVTEALLNGEVIS